MIFEYDESYYLNNNINNPYASSSVVLSFDGKPSPDNPRTPTLLRSSGVLTNSIKTSNIQRVARENRTQFPIEVIREICDDSDNDSTSTYNSDDATAEEQYMQPKYEVNIDFDEASKAWRANKRRIGESWVYIVKKSVQIRKSPQNSTESNSIASRVKERLNRRRTTTAKR